MTTLRALAGAGFLLAVIAFVVIIPVGWALVLYTGEKASAGQLKPHTDIGGIYTVGMAKGK